MTKELNLMELLEGSAEGFAPAGNTREATEASGKADGPNILGGGGIGALSVEEARGMDDAMERFVGDVLTEGTDYGTVKGAKRPSLLKPGAEKLCRFMGLSAATHIANRHEDYDSGVFGYEAKVTLVDADGVIRGEGCGSCNTRENRYLKSSAYNNANTCLKMAKKRALVDAVLNVACISGMFTQDIEDMPEIAGNGGNGNAARSGQRAASSKQLGYLAELMKKHNTSAASMDKYCKEHYGAESYRKISSSQASELIDKFRSVA